MDSTGKWATTYPARRIVILSGIGKGDHEISRQLLSIRQVFFREHYMSQITDLSVAILAGGKSVRFGSSKIYANLRGKSFLQHCIDNSLIISNSVYIISGKKAHIADNQIKSFQDFIPDKGPLGGIYTALEIAQTPLIAIMPCDMPFLKSIIYQNLYHNLVKQRPIAAVFRQRIQPLVSIWPKSISQKLKNYLSTNQTQVYKVLQKLNVQKFHISAEAEIFLNINTRKDYQVLLNSQVSEAYASRS
jgi:molybdopterin-guanine dinucleotide biosynthesis protein A